MHAFDYVKPATLKDAQKHLAQDEDAMLLAGGQTLIPTLKQGLATPSLLVDVSGLDMLRGVREAEGHIVIGAGTTHAEVATDALVAKTLPALGALAAHIGDPHVRHRGTLGGALANNDPAADYPAACLALNAVMETNKRRIAADDFFDGLFTTTLEPGEIIIAVHLPQPDKAAYMKHPQPASRYALAGVFVAQVSGGVRVAATGAGSDGVFQLKEMEDALTRSWSADALSAIEVDASLLSDDLHADPAYRAQLLKVLAERAVRRAG